MKKDTLKVNNLANFEFWVNMFKPRTERWQRQTLKTLKNKVSPFETLEENQDKIKALNFLLGNQ
jgi:hypothetical protein